MGRLGSCLRGLNVQITNPENMMGPQPPATLIRCVYRNTVTKKESFNNILLVTPKTYNQYIANTYKVWIYFPYIKNTYLRQF